MLDHPGSTIVDIADRKIEGHNLPLVIDDEVQLEPIEPACSAFPALGKAGKHSMRMNPSVVAYGQGTGINKTNPATLANPELHHVYCQNQEAGLHQFHKAIVADQMRETGAQMLANMVLVVPFEVPVFSVDGSSSPPSYQILVRVLSFFLPLFCRTHVI